MQSISGLELTSWMLRSITPKHATRLSVPSIDLISSLLHRPRGGSAGSLNGDGPAPRNRSGLTAVQLGTRYPRPGVVNVGHAGRGLLPISWSSDNGNHLFVNSVDEGSGGFSSIGTYLTLERLFDGPALGSSACWDDPGRVEEGQCSGRLPPIRAGRRRARPAAHRPVRRAQAATPRPEPPLSLPPGVGPVIARTGATRATGCP